MRKLFTVLVLLAVILSGCLPKPDDQDEVVKEDEESEQKAVVPKFQISESYYRTLSPFKPSDARGLISNNLSSRYDSDELEEGLLRISQKVFPTDEYIFQEGQYLDRKTVQNLLNRKMTNAQLKKKKLKPEDNIGLNPLIKSEKDEKAHTNNPIYLSHILEHNFLVKSKDNKVKLGGISLGLAINSVYYFTIDGKEHRVEIPDEAVEREGKRIAEELIEQIRKIEGLEDVPVVIGLFKQQDKTSIIPGNYFAYATAKRKSTSLDWHKVKEKYVLFPSNEATENYRKDAQQFDMFSTDIAGYFENYNGVIGKALYVDDELTKMSIDISMQFYGKTEVIGLSQYVAGLIVETFPEYTTTEVNIKSVTGNEALILKEPDMDEPFVYIY